MPVIPQFEFPLRIDDQGGLAEVEQGSASDIASRISILIFTPPGWLDSLPEFGLGDQAHLEGGADVAEVEAQIDRFIPSGELAIAIEEDIEGLNNALSVLDIRIGE